jgi:RNA polymerase sigma factor (sigma-70 family)
MEPRLARLVEEQEGAARSVAAQVWRTAPHAMELDELRSLAYAALVETASRWDEYCLVPTTPVLTADLRWVPMGDLEAGQQLVAFDESGPLRKLRRASVTETSRRLAECVRVEFTDGRQVVCTPGHKWLSTTPSRSNRWWRPAGVLTPGMRVMTPLRVWPQEDSFESGWLSGLYDGEGWLVRDGGRGVRGVGVAQRSGAVWDRVKQQLAAMGVDAHERDNGSVQTLLVHRSRDVIELLGRLRPLRLSTSECWEDKTMHCEPWSDSVVASVQRAGVREVVTLETSARTYIAGGMASHNCARHGYDPRRTEFFAPLAARRMRGAIYDTLRADDWAPRSQRTRYKLLQEAGLEQGLSEGELAGKTGLSTEEVRSTLAGMGRRPVSLDADATREYVDPGDVHEDAAQAAFLRALAECVRSLPGPQRAVLALHYYAGRELQQVAVLLGITESRASHLHTDGVLAVREVLARSLGA